MSLALPYDKHRSVEYRDVSQKTMLPKRSKFVATKSRLGSCFGFQKKLDVLGMVAPTHKCERFHSPRHGKLGCGKEKRLRKWLSSNRKIR